MLIDENKYNNLFITKFAANENEVRSEFKRILEEHGQTEEIKLLFYKTLFDNLIAQLKREAPKDENYVPFITALYNYFIGTLKEDKIDASKYESELESFRKREIPKATIKNSTTAYVPEFKNYNLNTKYGRRKAREQANRNYENGTPEYRKEIDSIKTGFLLILIAIAIIIFTIKIALTSK